MVQVIEPGGRDRDFPAFEVTSGFFDVLAASVSYNLGEAPGFLAERRFSGWQIVCERGGESRHADAEDIECSAYQPGVWRRPF